MPQTYKSHSRNIKGRCQQYETKRPGKSGVGSTYLYIKDLLIISDVSPQLKLSSPEDARFKLKK